MKWFKEIEDTLEQNQKVMMQQLKESKKVFSDNELHHKEKRISSKRAPR
jgi:hypothetical protein